MEIQTEIIETIDSESVTESNQLKLPLWRSCVELMREQGLTYGKIYATEFFESNLRCQRDSQEFQFGMMHIYSALRKLEPERYVLTCRGQEGKQYIVLPPNETAEWSGEKFLQAQGIMLECYKVGCSVPKSLLNESEQKIHESRLERMGNKLALLNRSKAIFNAVKNIKPKLIE